MPGIAEKLVAKSVEVDSSAPLIFVPICLHCGKTKPPTMFWGQQLLCKECDSRYFEGQVRTAYFKKRQYGWNKKAGPDGELGYFTWEQFKALVRHYGNRCLRCKKRFHLDCLTPDHIVPSSQNGLNQISNIQPLCKSCNTAKKAKHTDYRPKR